MHCVTICRTRAFMLAGRAFVSLDQRVCSHGCDLFPISYIRYRCVAVPPARRAPMVLACGAVRAPPRARRLRNRQDRGIHVGVNTHFMRRGFGGPIGRDSLYGWSCPNSHSLSSATHTP